MKRSLPNYVNAPETMRILYDNMLQFVRGNSPRRLMIIAGDTLIGKSFLLRKMLDELYIVRHCDLPARFSGLQSISYDIRFTIGEQMDLLGTIWGNITISGEEKYGTQEEVYTMHEEAYDFHA